MGRPKTTNKATSRHAKLVLCASTTTYRGVLCCYTARGTECRYRDTAFPSLSPQIYLPLLFPSPVGDRLIMSSTAGVVRSAHAGALHPIAAISASPAARHILVSACVCLHRPKWSKLFASAEMVEIDRASVCLGGDSSDTTHFLAESFFNI
jgi:hypothetical protein